jgi:YggT family protein
MFIFSSLFVALARVVDMVCGLYTWVIVFRALISWVNPDPFNPIVQFLERSTEPLLGPIRRRLPRLPIDISPIILLLAVAFLQTFLVRVLYSLAGR